MARYRRVPALERSLAGGRRYVQPVGATVPIELGGSAPVIWDLLAEVSDSTQLRAVVQRTFDDEPAVIAAGTRLALEQLLEAGLIVVDER